MNPLPSNPAPRHILALNAGSSSLKAALFDAQDTPRQVASLRIDRIGTPEARLTARFSALPPTQTPAAAPDHEHALDLILRQLAAAPFPIALVGVGHRVVHGGPDYSSPRAIDAPLLDALKKLEPFDPEHLPAQVRLIQLLLARLPDIPHVAVFDTAFHHALPAVSRRLPLPRKFDALGVRRYGFHGISYAFLLQELQRLDPRAAQQKIVIAHLGNGASLAAIQHARCIDTSMAFTPAAGIPMGTRSGDLDPGLFEFLRTAGITPDAFNRIVHLESGLLGISETSPDMAQLLQRQHHDPRAAEAVAIFCYHVQKCIGAYAAALGGLDTLVFSGGIGQHAAEVRARVCANLAFLGVHLDAALNQVHAPLISPAAAPVKVRVMATDEELMIAREVLTLLPPA